ncbi:MAG: hypothetical protein WCA99_17320 [Candidatus Sulfotelmatobacter sp.]
MIGDVTLAPADGLETVNGKSVDPVPQSEFAGSSAVGAGSLLLPADQVIGSAGVEGYEGWAGVGVGAGAGVVFMLELAPHPAEIRSSSNKSKIPQNDGTQPWGKTARIHHPPLTG